MLLAPVKFGLLFTAGAIIVALSGGQFIANTTMLSQPSSVQPSENNFARRFNFITGSNFTISCNVTRSDGELFNADFYYEGFNGLITEGSIVNTSYSKTGTNGVSSEITLELTFHNFQPIHNGRYECFANTTNSTVPQNRLSVGHVLYGTGSVHITMNITDIYQVLYDDLIIIAVSFKVRGEFYDILWYFNPERIPDPNTSVPLVIARSIGTFDLFFRQTFVADPHTQSHLPGYYLPTVVDPSRNLIVLPATLYRSYAAPQPSMSPVVRATGEANLTVACTATGYPRVDISFSTEGVSASTSEGELVTIVTATPNITFTVTRSITFFNRISSIDCGSIICTASNENRSGMQSNATTVYIPGPPNVTISPADVQAVPIGGNVVLTCSASDCLGNMYSYAWFKDGTKLPTNNKTLNVTIVSLADFGFYQCCATGDGGRGKASTQVLQGSRFEMEAVVQLFLFRVDCLAWISPDRSKELSDVQTHIINEMAACERCTANFINSTSTFTCIGAETGSVVFRGVVNYTYSSLSDSDPLSLLNEWISNSPLVSVNNLQLQVDGRCVSSLPVSSLSSPPVCVEPPVVAIVLGSVAGLVLLALAISILVLIVIFVRKRRIKKHTEAISNESKSEEYEVMHTDPSLPPYWGSPDGVMMHMTSSVAYESKPEPEYDTIPGETYVEPGKESDVEEDSTVIQNDNASSKNDSDNSYV